jgi:hypothetical protein
MLMMMVMMMITWITLTTQPSTLISDMSGSTIRAAIRHHLWSLLKELRLSEAQHMGVCG